jgi:hypothetical protein
MSSINKTKSTAGKGDKDDDERASKKPKTTETTTTTGEVDDRPDWIKDKQVMSGSYMVVYQESNVDNQAVLYDDPNFTDSSTDMIDRFGRMKLTFSSSTEEKDGAAGRATIVSLTTTDPRTGPPVGNLSNGKISNEENDWLWEYEWRPCAEFLNESYGRRFFENYAYSEEIYEYDEGKPETNFIEFTINGTIKSVQGRLPHNWEFIDETGLEQLPGTCLLAHFHTVTRTVCDNGDPRQFDSYILCREEDFDRVRDVLSASIKRHELYSTDEE